MINSRSATGSPSRNLDFRSTGKVEAEAADPAGVDAGQRLVVIATTPISSAPQSGSPGTPGAPIETAFPRRLIVNLIVRPVPTVRKNRVGQPFLSCCPAGASA